MRFTLADQAGPLAGDTLRLAVTLTNTNTGEVATATAAFNIRNQPTDVGLTGFDGQSPATDRWVWLLLPALVLGAWVWRRRQLAA